MSDEEVPSCMKLTFPETLSITFAALVAAGDEGVPRKDIEALLNAAGDWKFWRSVMNNIVAGDLLIEPEADKPCDEWVLRLPTAAEKERIAEFQRTTLRDANEEEL